MNITLAAAAKLDAIQALALDLPEGHVLRVSFAQGSQRGWHRTVTRDGDVTAIRVMVEHGFSIMAVEELTV